MNGSVEIPGLDHAVGLPARPIHLAVGIFDGVHLGHRSVIDAARMAAGTDQGIVGALTFWPHPSRLFTPDRPVRMIQSSALKHRHLLAAGAEFVISEPFTREFAAIEADDFIPYLRRRLPTLRALYVGENWRYGRGRAGDFARLRVDGPKHGVTVVGATGVTAGGVPVSSTRIRAALSAGRIEEANQLLGYAYYAEGTVTPGKQLGRTIGFPTLNVPWHPDLQPALGVYAVRIAAASGGAGFPAVANFGLRPTVERTTEPRLEVHVLGECPFGAGAGVRVEWLSFLRPERSFGGLEELRAQIGRDREQAVAWFGC